MLPQNLLPPCLLSHVLNEKNREWHNILNDWVTSSIAKVMLVIASSIVTFLVGIPTLLDNIHLLRNGSNQILRAKPHFTILSSTYRF